MFPIVKPGCPSWSLSGALVYWSNCDPTESTLRPAATSLFQRPLRYPPLTPSVIESPRGMRLIVPVETCGVDEGIPHTLATPAPPQVWGAPQLPHWSVPPQPSEMLPQLLP